MRNLQQGINGGRRKILNIKPKTTKQIKNDEKRQKQRKAKQERKINKKTNLFLKVRELNKQLDTLNGKEYAKIEYEITETMRELKNLK